MIVRAAILGFFCAAGSLAAQTATDQPVRAQGAPRSFQVVRVAVPAELHTADNVSYAVYATNEFTVVGRAAGSVQPRTAADVLITIGVPASALAGTRRAARVMFAAGAAEVNVPIDMTVTRTQGLVLRAPDELTGLRPGDRLRIPVTIQNRGNAADTVHLSLELPAGWRTTRDSTQIIVPAFGAVEHVISSAVPTSSGTGNFFVRMSAQSQETTARALVPLTVGPTIAEISPLGAVVRATVGSVIVEGGSAQAVPQIALSGPLISGINVDGRITATPELSAPLVRGLATVGAFVTAPHLVAWTPTWRATLGSTVLAMTDLSGVNAGGRGLAFDHADSTRIISLIAARSNEGSAAGNNHGELYGLRFEQNLEHFRLGGTATRLRGVGLQHHELTAFGVQARSYPMHSFTFGGETAYRRFRGGSGMGWTARVEHERNDDRAELRITHAPGGSEAFARAENEVQLSFLTKLGDRLDVLGSFAAAEDETSTGYRYDTHSFGLAPSFLLSDMLRIRADVRRTSFDVAANPIGYGNAETHFGIGAGGLVRGTGISTDVGIARLERSVTAADIDASEYGTRLSWRMNASRFTNVGIFELETSYERNNNADGFLPEQFVVTARADRMQIPALSSRLELDAELTVQSWSGVSTTPVFRAGAQYVLAQTAVAIGIERNPLLTGITQKTPWIFALKVERSLGLPRLMTGRATGIVFRDFNGNGRHDAGEPGVADVAVRRGSARATTSHDGGYRFWEEGRGSLSVDPGTLPPGWIVGERHENNIALVATTRLEVRLDPGPAERLRNLDVSPVAVIARDVQGREWTARRTSAELAVFEALPVGSYTIEANFSAMAEPLRAVSVFVDVTEGNIARATLVIAGRPLRFRQDR